MPPSGCIKFNSDASIYSGANSVSLDGVFKDEYGVVVAAFAKNRVARPRVSQIYSSPRDMFWASSCPHFISSVVTADLFL
ncbi:hypothetical protein PanWU01x14_210260 [Parasponia andersonii]|uniref:Uncharacterized protein n=1 Tax=Parasponia andersonii TaxID=3476 RepID=A0A2P5BU53_PARAD|nr:hypothetical protein PanWU01x14_210260 [Parasponia andersonii]